MSRLRYNGLATGSSGSTVGLTLGSSLTSGATSVTFSAALTYNNGTAVPTIVSPDYIPLSILDTNGNLSEIVYLTAYTTGGTTGTITRGQEGTTGVAQASGNKIVQGPSAFDLNPNVDTYLPTYVQAANLNTTYGDAFTGTSLNARWTRRTVASGNETWQRVGGTDGVKWGTSVGAGWLYLQTAPAGDFQVHATIGAISAQATSLCGPVIVDSTGAGVGLGTRAAVSAAPVNLSAYVFGSYGSGAITDGSLNYRTRTLYTMSIKKVGTTYTFGYAKTPEPAWSDIAWSPEGGSVTWAGTVDRIGVGCMFTDAAFPYLEILRFNVTTAL